MAGCKPSADSRFVPSQWETSLQCNAVSHWLSANLKSALISYITTEPWSLVDSFWNVICKNWPTSDDHCLIQLWWDLMLPSFLYAGYIRRGWVLQGVIPGMASASERRRCIVTSPLFGWAHTNSEPWHLLRNSLSGCGTVGGIWDVVWDWLVGIDCVIG